MNKSKMPNVDRILKKNYVSISIGISWRKFLKVEIEKLPIAAWIEVLQRVYYIEKYPIQRLNCSNSIEMKFSNFLNPLSKWNYLAWLLSKTLYSVRKLFRYIICDSYSYVQMIYEWLTYPATFCVRHTTSSNGINSFCHLKTFSFNQFSWCLYLSVLHTYIVVLRDTRHSTFLAASREEYIKASLSGAAT